MVIIIKTFFCHFLCLHFPSLSLHSPIDCKTIQKVQPSSNLSIFSLHNSYHPLVCLLPLLYLITDGMEKILLEYICFNKDGIKWIRRTFWKQQNSSWWWWWCVCVWVNSRIYKLEWLFEDIFRHNFFHLLSSHFISHSFFTITTTMTTWQQNRRGAERKKLLRYWNWIKY